MQKFPGISGNSQESAEIPRNQRKFPGLIHGKIPWKFFREYPGKDFPLRNSWNEHRKVAGFWLGLDISRNPFRGISCDPFWGISHNPFQGISRNPFRGIARNPIWEIFLNLFWGISLYQFWKITEENVDRIQGNSWEFLEKSSSEQISGNFLETILKIFSRVSQEYLELFSGIKSWVNSITRT